MLKGEYREGAQVEVAPVSRSRHGTIRYGRAVSFKDGRPRMGRILVKMRGSGAYVWHPIGRVKNVKRSAS